MRDRPNQEGCLRNRVLTLVCMFALGSGPALREVPTQAFAVFVQVAQFRTVRRRLAREVPLDDRTIDAAAPAGAAEAHAGSAPAFQI